MTKLNKLVIDNDAEEKITNAMILSRDISPWKAEQLYSVKKEIVGADNVILNGKYYSKVFEGPYQNVKMYYQEMLEYAKKEGFTPTEIYFFYTTCPKCAKKYGKNYIIGLIKIEK